MRLNRHGYPALGVLRQAKDTAPHCMSETRAEVLPDILFNVGG